MTNEAGIYEVPYLAPGIYALTVEQSGFKKHVHDGIEARVGDKLTVHVQLELGSATG